MIIDCVQSMHMSAHIVSVHHSVTTRSWADCMSHLSLLSARGSSIYIIVKIKKNLDYVVLDTSITPSGMTDAVYPACMHTLSTICLWATILVYNMVSVMYFKP